MPEQMSRKEIMARLAKALRATVAQHEENLRKNAVAEVTGNAKLTKEADVWSPDTDGKVRGSVIERNRTAAAPKKSAKGIRGVAADSIPVAKCGEITKDEMIDGPQPTGEAPPADPGPPPVTQACPACGVGEAEPLGPMDGMAHFLCASGCGTTFSTPRQENAEAHVDDPLAKTGMACSTPVAKQEPSPDGYIDVKNQGDAKKRIKDESGAGKSDLPTGPGKAVEAEGSGGDTSKGKMAKAIPGAGGAVKKSPTDTANSASIVANSTGKPEAHLAAAQAHWAAATHAQNTGNVAAAKTHTEAMHAHAKASKMHSAGLSKAGIPGLDAPPRPLPRQAPLPGMTPPPAGTPHPETVRTLASIRALKTARAATPPPTPAAAMAPAKVPAPGALAAGGQAAASTQQAAAPSFISGLLAKFKGVGSKMAMAEVPMDKTTVDEANKELKGFVSDVKNPTAMPGNVKKPKPVAKSDGTGAPAMPKMPKPAVASAPAAPAQKTMGTKTAGAAAPGATKPKAPKA